VPGDRGRRDRRVAAAGRAGAGLGLRAGLPADGGSIDLPDDLVELSLRAIARVLDEESEWRDLWVESDGLEDAITALEPIRAALNR